ncbi:hypothetical protein BD413DRAFT_306795 [Trametes elegans]|nr:hypothetical protein BD413DRAFT_306795 [Trametes elegans]
MDLTQSNGNILSRRERLVHSTDCHAHATTIPRACSGIRWLLLFLPPYINPQLRRHVPCRSHRGRATHPGYHARRRSIGQTEAEDGSETLPGMPCIPCEGLSQSRGTSKRPHWKCAVSSGRGHDVVESHCEVASMARWGPDSEITLEEAYLRGCHDLCRSQQDECRGTLSAHLESHSSDGGCRQERGCRERMYKATAEYARAVSCRSLSLISSGAAGAQSLKEVPSRGKVHTIAVYFGRRRCFSERLMIDNTQGLGGSKN